MLTDFLQSQEQSQAQPLVTPQQPAVKKRAFPLIKEKKIGNQCLSVEQILEEQKRYAEFKEKNPHRQDDAIMKTLNNRKRIAEELDLLIKSSPTKTQAEGIQELNRVQVLDKKSKKMRPWQSINELFKYCQAKKIERDESAVEEQEQNSC